MITRHTLFMLMLPLLLLASCGEEVTTEYSDHQAYYTIDFQYGHIDSPLHQALTSVNTFCTISVLPQGTGYTLVAQLAGATPDEEHVMEEVLTRPTRLLGLNNGLIVGKSSFQDGELYVFDRQCPNCVAATMRYNYPLSLMADGMNVKCDACDRQYSLLSAGAVTAGGNGQKLMRYRARYTGTQFTVSNPQ